MKIRDRLGVVLAAAALVVAPAVLPAAPALGLDVDVVEDPLVGSSPPVQERVRRCTLYASELGFGASCTKRTGGIPLTWRQRVQPHKFVRCFDEPVPEGAEVPPSPPGRGAYFLENCIRGYDLDSYDGGPDAHIVVTLVWVPQGEERSIPPWMEWLWDRFDAAYPTPLLQIGPTLRPRVNVPAYFWVADATAQPITRIVFDGGQDVVMRAELARLVVLPGVEAGEAPVFCPDPTEQYDFGRSPFEQFSTCTYTYTRSSAHLPDEMYPAEVHAFWRVTYENATGEHLLGEFDISVTQMLPVQEAQSVNWW